MPITDLGLVGLLQIFQAQQKDILEMKKEVIVMRRLLLHLTDGAAAPQLEGLREEFDSHPEDQKSIAGSLAAVAQIDQTIAALLPTTGTKN